jgi:lipopolysaccharide transport system permease protein
MGSTVKMSAAEIAPPYDYEVVIKPPTGWLSINWKELWHYRDTFYFLVRRDLKARYVQSVLGVGWAIAIPLVQMVIYTFIFGNLVHVKTDGAPYAIFSYAALVPWAYFANSLTAASNSLIQSATLIGKVYFPRIILPLAALVNRLFDFLIAMAMLFFIMLFFHAKPTIWIVFLPVLVIILMLSAAGLGMFLAALAVQYRDVAYGMGLATIALQYLSPVIYPTSLVPQHLRRLYALNPMVGVIEGFRSALLATNPMPWDLIGIGSISAIVIFLIGFFYFLRREYFFADVA